MCYISHMVLEVSIEKYLCDATKVRGGRAVKLHPSGAKGIPDRLVILPGALPSILVGVRFALGFMWLTLIVAETISASSGIGYLAMNAREFLQTDVVVLAIVLYAVLGKLADTAARGLERIWLRWHPAYQVVKGGAA